HRAGQGPSHPCARGRADHRSSHSRPRHCPRRGSSHSQAQGQSPRGRTTRQGHRPRSSSAPSHRRGTRSRRANTHPRGAFRRASPIDQAHRRPRAGAVQEEALVQEEDEGARARPGRRGPRESQGRGAYHR
uniref:Uncharacterized protein n=1 Tax=Triticum urartu TaxID=4572 RepID=A0A8R7UZW8_TRIUA